MKHVDLATLPRPSRVKYVHDALTGRVITSRTVGLSNPWSGQWIMEAVASWNDCDADDLSSDDDDNILLGGKVVARVSVG